MRRPSPRLIRRAAASTAIAVALLGGAYTVAWAHAMLASASPAPRSTVATAPADLRLVFTEPVDVSLCKVALIRGTDTTALVLRAEPDNRRVLLAAVTGAPTGQVTVRWRVVSSDGHPSSGSYIFTIAEKAASPDTTAPSAAPATTPATTGPPAVAPANTAPDTAAPGTVGTEETMSGVPVVGAILRGLAVGCLTMLVGLLWFAGRRGAPRSVASRRFIGIVAVAAPLLLAAHFVAWVAHATGAAAGVTSIAEAFRASAGQVEIARIILAALAFAAFTARRDRAALVIATLAVLVSGATGHAAAISPIIATPAKAVHLLAVSAWLGGLAWLVLVARNDPSNLLRQGLRVSSAALVASVLVILSGVVQTLLFVTPVTAVLHSTYGYVVLLKVLGVMGLVAFGGYHRYRMLPRLATLPVREARRSFTREVALMWVVVLLGGVLAYVAPPM